jgi:ABC-type branched-subunit amino acid transport system substrate-binding protein
MRRTLSAGVVHGVLAISCLMTGIGLITGTSAAAEPTASGGAPIVVGGDGDLLQPGVPQGFEAGIYRFNKAGGLDGRKITFTGFLNDSFSAQTNLTNAQQLVENEHVFAVVPFVSAVATGATGTFLTENKIPFIGWATNPAYLAARKWGFGIDGNQSNPNVAGASSPAGFSAMVKGSGKVKMALIAEDVAPGIAALDDAAGAVKSEGADVVYTGSPIAEVGTTNYAPYAQAIIASHPNVVFEVLDLTDCVGLAVALKAAGYKGAIVNGVSYLPGELASSPSEANALNGVYVINTFPANVNNTPAVKQAEKDLEAIGQPPDLSDGVSQGYWSAIVFEQMLRATLKRVGGNPSKVTSVALQQTVTHGFTYTDPIPGGLGTEHWPAAATIPTGCGGLLQTVGNGFKALGPYQCLGAYDWKSHKKMNEVTGQPIS